MQVPCGLEIRETPLSFDEQFSVEENQADEETDDDGELPVDSEFFERFQDV